MSCLRVSTLKLIRRFPFTQVTTISCIQKFDVDRQRAYYDYSKYGNGSIYDYRRYYADDAKGKKGKDTKSDKAKPPSSSSGAASLVDCVPLSEIIRKGIKVMREVEMKELSKAPSPVFWYVSAGLLPIVVPPLSFMLFGYSSLLANMQLVFAATTCAFIGGVKWGYSLPNNEKHPPTWENIGWSVVPQVIAWMGLLLPHQLGLLTVTAGLGLAAFVDLTASNYPSWFKAVRLAATIPIVVALLLTFLLWPFRR